MSLRYNPAPNWPPPPAGWTPPPGWAPDPAWGPAPEGHQVWLPQRNWFRRHPGWTVVLVVFVVIPVGLGIIGAIVGGQSDSPSAAESAFGATHSVSEHDANVVAGLSKFSRSWNDAAAPFIADYQDPNIGGAEWAASETRTWRRCATRPAGWMPPS